MYVSDLFFIICCYTVYSALSNTNNIFDQDIKTAMHVEMYNGECFKDTRYP